MLSNDEQQKLNDLLCPSIKEKEQFLKDNKIQLAYYTNAETAVNIIKNGELWLRNTALMNDYLETKLGFKYINDVLFSSLGNKLDNILINYYKKNNINPNENLFTDFVTNKLKSYINNTYIICFTEHYPQEENTGRLSMWRAYGGDNGVAFVFKSHDSIKYKLYNKLTPLYNI